MINKKSIILFLIFFLLPFFSNAEERINNFDVTVGVNNDSTINVIENIKYDYDNLQNGIERHGLYRDIPYTYQASYGTFNFDFSDVKVNTDNFESYDYGDYLRIDTNPDPDIHVSGVKDYSFEYKVGGAVGYFEDFDEIYWNSTGNEWNVPIDIATAKIILPKPLPKDKIKVSCYEGYSGSVENCTSNFVENNGLVEAVIFSATRNLGPQEGITVAVGFPKGIVYEPTAMERTTKAIKDNLIFTLPVFVFLIMFYLWYTKGRDPKGSGVIVPQYDVPDGLIPMEMSVIVHQRVRSEDISAEIINLAIKGLIKINKIETQGIIFKSTDYVFELLNRPSGVKISKIQEKLLDSLFGIKTEVKLSDLTEKFYKKSEVIMEEVIDKVVSDGYYVSNPQDARAKYAIIAIILFFVSIYSSILIGSGFILVSIISFIIIFSFSFLMSKKTEKGVLVYEYILGLKDYLQIAEKDRINFHNAPDKRPEIFEKLLPYAMVLGVEKAWAKEFEDIYTTPPNWYHDTSGGSFNSVLFTNSMSSFSSYASSTLTSAPGGHSGSGGGGSSGGGGGGGGGGSH
ncbi:MAG: DUF2207 domain-containing protein [bacterium]